MDTEESLGMVEKGITIADALMWISGDAGAKATEQQVQNQGFKTKDWHMVNH